MSMPRPPYFGAAYYPEDWPLAQIDEDIALMLRAGMNCMRIGEFAWSSMEPDEGRYEFGWLHTVVDKLAAAGLATILGTPTCTPPIWLVERYPEVLFVLDDGRPSGHGARRHACPNSPVYRDHCARIVSRMADESGQDDRILGWQIDNEVYAIGGWPPRSCCCPVCLQLFREKMRAEFGTIEALNDAWCLSLWSQAYQSFDQLPDRAHRAPEQSGAHGFFGGCAHRRRRFAQFGDIHERQQVGEFMQRPGGDFQARQDRPAQKGAVAGK